MLEKRKFAFILTALFCLQLMLVVGCNLNYALRRGPEEG